MESVQIDWELSDDTGELFAVLSLTEIETRIDALSVKDAMQGNGHDGFFMEEGAVDALLRVIDERVIGRVPVARRLDAQVSISVTEDAMQAFISTTPSFGGQPLTEARLQQAIETQNISYAICNRQSIEQALASKNKHDRVP